MRLVYVFKDKANNYIFKRFAKESSAIRYALSKNLYLLGCFYDVKSAKRYLGLEN